MSDILDLSSTSVALSGTDVVLFSGDLGNLEGLLFAMKNTGAVNTLGASPVVSSSPDSSNWTVEDNASIGALAPAAYGRAKVLNTYGIKYWKLTATCVAGTTVTWWIQGHKP